MPDYSVIIRTTGKAGEKYARLLASIDHLEPQPKEIIVVLPEGYVPPKETLGREMIYYCPKGMVRQRLYGISVCRTRYALISDDDIAFEPDFVQKLSKPVMSGEYGFSAGPLLCFFPPAGAKSVLAAIIGASVPTLFHKDRYNSVLKTTGYSYNRNIEVGSGRLYETQSAPWTCFFADLEAMRAIHFEDESWLDMHGYSALDDTAMFYKAWLCGQKCVIVSDAPYEHLDAKTSTRGNHEIPSYAGGFNMVVFGKRFLYDEAEGPGKLWCRMCISYRTVLQKLYNRVNCLRGKMTKAEFQAYDRGIADAKRWVKSEEYAKLPPIRR